MKKSENILPSLIALIFLYIIGIIAKYHLIPKVHSNKKILNYFCDINASAKIKSTPRDVILFYCTSDAKGLRLSIQSLRSTGSQCQIILFISSSFEITKEFLEFCQILQVTLVPKCDEMYGREENPHMLRYEFELNWLLKHEGQIDRIFHSDAYDVFFQGDPFSLHIKNDKLTFVIEPHCVRSCGWNFAWIKNCYNFSGLQEMRHTFIACSGSIAGSVHDYIKLLKLMLRQPEWKRCWHSSYDQPILNWLLWHNIIRDEGIQYEIAGCESGFYTMQWCVLDHKVRLNEHNQVITDLGVVPSFLHQYNRITDFDNFLYGKCHLI